MEFHLRIIGYMLIGLSMVHAIFPKYFNWGKDLENISLINKQLMYVHTFFIGLTLMLMGVILVFAAEDIVHTKLGKLLALGFFLFWSIRLVFQFFVYSPKLWWGKYFETTVHVVFSFLWIYFTVIFLMVYMGDEGSVSKL